MAAWLPAKRLKGLFPTTDVPASDSAQPVAISSRPPFQTIKQGPANLSQSSRSQVLTPTRIAIGLIAAIIFIAVAVTASKLRQGNSAARSPISSAPAPPTSETGQATANSSTHAEPDPPQPQASRRSGQSTANSSSEADQLPTEFLRDRSPELPLVRTGRQLAQEHFLGSIRFSPKGEFASAAATRPDGHAFLRLWNVATGQEVMARSDECNYFSFPAVFSPDEKRIACVDGELLRIWSIQGDLVKLSQMISLGLNDWNSIVWSNESSIIVSSRTPLLKYFFNVLRSDNGSAFTPAASVVSVPIRLPLDEGFHEDATVCPDGNTLLVVGQDKSGENITFRNTRTGETSRIGLPAEGLQKQFLTPSPQSIARPDTTASAVFGHAVLQAARSIASDTTKQEQPSAVLFSPNGQIMAASFAPSKSSGRRSTIAQRWTTKLWKTGSWHEIVTLSDDGLFSDASIYGTGKSACRIVLFSPDGSKIMGVISRTVQTSEGGKLHRSVVVWSTADGKKLREVPIADATNATNGGLNARVDATTGLEFPVMAFSNDGKSLYIGNAAWKGWATTTNRDSGVRWTLAAWSIETGESEFELDGSDSGYGGMALSPDARLLITNSSRVWDVEHLVSLKRELAEGNRLWESGDKAKSLVHYAGILGDTSGWFFDDQTLRRLWSRCIDAYAEAGDDTSGTRVIAYARNVAHIPLSPETPSGRKLLESFVARHQQLVEQQNQQANDNEARRVAGVRAKNQQNRVRASSLTKAEFIDKLRQTMAQGRIDDLATTAFFRDYAFQDVFGDPDSNVEWTDNKRLYMYRCSNGSIQLTVMVIDAQVIVEGINEY
jgi:hypothetical protein